MPIALFSVAVVAGLVAMVAGALADTATLITAITGLVAAIGGAIGIVIAARQTKTNTKSIASVTDRVDTLETNGNGRAS